jgi:hypothetical protein
MNTVSPTREPSHPSLPNHEPANGAGLTSEGEDEARVSVTEVDGSVARFDMAYSAPKREKIAFGPPLAQLLPSLFFVAFALAMVAFVFVGETRPPGSRFYAFVVEGDRGRPLSARTLAFLVLASSLGTALRARMRGVIVKPDGVEARYLLPMGIPRIRRWAWSQIERIVVDDTQVMFELWNGQYERLPAVAEPKKLSALLEHIAITRNLRLTRLRPPTPSRGTRREGDPTS